VSEQVDQQLAQGQTLRLALVCEDAAERQAVIKPALEQLGFTMVAAKNPAEAIERMRRDTYEVVILDEQYQGATPLDNPVLATIRSMPMSARRYMFVALLGREFKTFDNMMAFAKSVNVVVNLNDLPHLPAILRKGIADNNEFYRVLRGVLQETGRR
jgi:CheY-like chemotaxis protein